jgi:hypothetical protein
LLLEMYLFRIVESEQKLNADAASPRKLARGSHDLSPGNRSAHAV